MKTILISLSALFVSFTSFAQTENLQYIDCSATDIRSNDRVIVSLTDENNGTFFYTSGLSDGDDEARTGKLILKRTADIAAQKDMAQFKAIFKSAENGDVEFRFSMPKAEIFKKSDYFRASFEAMGYGRDLSCFARIYPKN